MTEAGGAVADSTSGTVWIFLLLFLPCCRMAIRSFLEGFGKKATKTQQTSSHGLFEDDSGTANFFLRGS